MKKTQFRKLTEHELAHQQIDEKLDHILHKVSANGNPGLDASLKDLYQGQQEIKRHQMELMAQVATVYALVKPDLDRAAFWRSAKEMFKSSPFFKFHSTPVGFALLVVAGILIVNALLFPFLGVPVVTWTTVSSIIVGILHKLGVL